MTKTDLVFSKNSLSNLDLILSNSIYKFFGNKYLKVIPNILGLIPYEMYVIPGMYIAILQVIWLGTPNPIQFHLLPHWFSYSIFQFLKGKIKRPRPGCFQKSMSDYIDDGHCKHGHELKSFPSGHSGVAMSLAMSLLMEMLFSENPHFFEISINNKIAKYVIATFGILMALMVGLHRISKGYHSLFDVSIGFLIGGSIGVISWVILEYYKKKYNKLCKKNMEQDECGNYKANNTGEGEFMYWINQFRMFNYDESENKTQDILFDISRIILTIPVLFLLFKFLTIDLFKLATIKH